MSQYCPSARQTQPSSHLTQLKDKALSKANSLICSLQQQNQFLRLQLQQLQRARETQKRLLLQSQSLASQLQRVYQDELNKKLKVIRELQQRIKKSEREKMGKMFGVVEIGRNDRERKLREWEVKGEQDSGFRIDTDGDLQEWVRKDGEKEGQKREEGILLLELREEESLLFGRKNRSDLEPAQTSDSMETSYSNKKQISRLQKKTRSITSKQSLFALQ